MKRLAPGSNPSIQSLIEKIRCREFSGGVSDAEKFKCVPGQVLECHGSFSRTRRSASFLWPMKDFLKSQELENKTRQLGGAVRAEAGPEFTSCRGEANAAHRKTRSHCRQEELRIRERSSISFSLLSSLHIMCTFERGDVGISLTSIRHDVPRASCE